MNKKSFTLIELLVVIAIIGILSSLVIARFSNWNDNARIANTLQWSSGVHRTLGANLVGHWPLNGNVNDISGYGNNGTVVGSPSWVSGVLGTDNGLRFDGSNDYVSVPNHVDMGSSYTIMGWVKVEDGAMWPQFIGRERHFSVYIAHDRVIGYIKGNGSG